MNISSFTARLSPPEWMIPKCEPSVSSGKLFIYLIQNSYFHELGHACAIKALTVNENPKIFFGQNGAYTIRRKWCKIHLNRLGKRLGLHTCKCIVASAGILVDILTQLFLELIAQRTHFQYPVFSFICRSVQFLIITENFLYALDSCFDKRESSDFVQLQAETGIHPLVFSVIFAAQLFFQSKKLV